MYTGKPKYLLFNKHFFVLTLLTLGVVTVVSVAGQKTQTQQQASESINLNSADEVDSAINSDGTMGPPTTQGNFSNSLPIAYLGSAAISVTGTDNSFKYSSITLSISKAEAHLVYLFMPGTSNASATEGISGQRTNQNVNKWETLQLSGNADNHVDMKLENGLINALGYTQLAGGKYSEIRLYISKASARLMNGEEIELVLPGGVNIIRVAQVFNIFSNKTTSLRFDLDTKSSIIQEGDTYFLKPVISRFGISN